jgi:uncharacterized protein (DUF433 family)
MPLTIHFDPSVLRVDEGGAVRIGKTRVTLDTLVGEYSKGETAEQIAQNFPTLDLADIYCALGYYIRHRGEVDEYIREGERKFEEFRRSHPEMFSLQEKLRQRTEARKTS